jgi:SAM-dependent methyltransferase
LPLAYFSRSATAEFWAEHWGGHSVEELLHVARTSPLTGLIERYLPPRGCVLEAGCGIGQYVLLLRERRHDIVGVDWSVDAVGQGRRAGAPLAVMDLRRLGVRDRFLAAYVSLGVVEHDPHGPHAILGEAARVLARGGTLLISVPYWNGLRRLGWPALAWRSRRVRAAGGQFYQFAFTRAEICALLETHGFTVRAFHPYDPARILRHALARVTNGGKSGRGRGGGPAATPGRAGGRAVRALLYSGPGLRLFGHMLLAVGTKR